MVQLREKNLETREFLDTAKSLKSLLRKKGIPLIINDRVDIALAADAEGVHVGQNDMPVEDLRRLMGPGAIIGLSVESPEDARRANDFDIDYVGISPVYVTPTKTELRFGLGNQGVEEIVALSRFPTVGIGGMNHTTAGDTVRAGADGIAVVSAIVSADDPRIAAENLVREIKKARDGRLRHDPR